MINLTSKKDCCGCEACCSICPKYAISMYRDQEGFLYPKINASLCVKCGLCDKVCPIIHKVSETEKSQRAFLVQHKNQEILQQSTSGGAFTAIAEYVIGHGGVVFGAAFDENFSVIHMYAETKEELAKFRNSKYVQSKIGETFKQAKQFLQSGRMVCFSGTPCQIEGLHRFLRKDYDNLITVDVVCRAVPSPGIWKKYLDWENQKKKIVSVRFRDKKLGYQYSTMVLAAKDGSIQRDGIESQPWLRMFFSGMIIRPSCTKCCFRSPEMRMSDFTIWDCFNIYRLDKNFLEDAGTTRMLVHTKKGIAVLKQIKDLLQIREIPFDVAIENVIEMQSSPNRHEKSNAFFKDAKEIEMNELLQKYYPITWKVKLKKTARITLNRLKLDKVIKHILNKG